MGQTTWKSRKTSFQKGKCLEGGTNWNGWKLKVGVVGAIICHQDCNLRQGRNFPLLAALFKETEITNNLLSCWKMDLLASTGALHCVTTVTSTQVGLWTQCYCWINPVSFGWKPIYFIELFLRSLSRSCSDYKSSLRVTQEIDTRYWHMRVTPRLCGTENITLIIIDVNINICRSAPTSRGPAKLALLMKLLFNV